MMKIHLHHPKLEILMINFITFIVKMLEKQLEFSKSSDQKFKFFKSFKIPCD